MVACLIPTAPGKSTVDTAFCKWSTPCLTSKFSSQALKRTRKRFPRASCCNDTQAAFAKNSRCVACCASARQERIIWHFLLLPTSGTLRTSLPGSVCVSTDIHSWVVGVNPPSSRNSALLAGSRIWAAVRWAGLFWCFLKRSNTKLLSRTSYLAKWCLWWLNFIISGLRDSASEQTLQPTPHCLLSTSYLESSQGHCFSHRSRFPINLHREHVLKVHLAWWAASSKVPSAVRTAGSGTCCSVLEAVAMV